MVENVTLNLVIKYNVSKELIYISQSRFSQIITLTTLTYMSTLFFSLGKIISCTQDTSIFTARKRSLGQGNIFAPVCHSVHRVGGYLGRYPPGRYTHLGRYTPQAGTSPLARYTPSGQVHPQQRMLGYGQQAGDTHPTGMHSCPRCNCYSVHSFKIIDDINLRETK